MTHQTVHLEQAITKRVYTIGIYNSFNLFPDIYLMKVILINISTVVS